MKAKHLKTAHENSQLVWHLRNNVMPTLSENIISQIMITVTAFNLGILTLDSEIKEGAGVTVGEMFDDLKIEVE